MLYPDAAENCADTPLAICERNLDALTTNRPYRRASTVAQARVIILQAVGTHFDPSVIEAFRDFSDEDIERIRLRIG